MLKIFTKLLQNICGCQYGILTYGGNGHGKDVGVRVYLVKTLIAFPAANVLCQVVYSKSNGARFIAVRN